jgi:hypothetical protein
MVIDANRPMLDLRTVAPDALDFEHFRFGDAPGHCEVFPAQRLEHAGDLGIFAPESLASRTERVGALFADTGYNAVSVAVARLDNAMVDLVLGACCTSDGSLVTEAAYMPLAIDPELSSSGFMLDQTPVVDIGDTVLHCFPRSAGAFGHYLADCLPIAALLQPELAAGRMRLLVPPYLPDWAVRGLREIGVEREFCVFPTEKVLRCRRLVIPSTLDTSSTFRPNPGLINVLRAAVGPLPAPRSGRRVWLSRRNQHSFSHRRLLNEEAVQALLAGLGFESIEPGNMPLRAQIEACATAEIIAGVHGSAFGNLAFAAPGTRVVDLMPDAWIDFWGPANTAERWLLRLTSALNLNYALVLCPSDLVRVLPDADRSGLQHFGMDFRANPDLVARAATAPLHPAGRRGASSAASVVSTDPSLVGYGGESAMLRSDSLEAISLLSNDALEPLFRPSDRRGVNSAWWGHVPFAGWIIRAAQPRVFVELGTFSGVSYAAFCQAALADHISTACHAVDTWNGDPHAGIFDDSVYLDFKSFHDSHYRAISQIHRCSFDDARSRFEDGSVDLLHIDGYHTYEAVRHDFETWLPKLSSRAVVLFHDTNERMNDFGVWQFWDEVSARWPSFSFLHSHGLGVLCVGSERPPAVAQLCGIQDPKRIETIQKRFALLGDRWYAQAQWEVSLARAESAESRAAAAESSAAEAKGRAEAAKSRAHVAEHHAELAGQRAEMAGRRADVAERRVTEMDARTQGLERSVSWQITAPLRFVSSHLPWAARQTRRAVRFARVAAAHVSQNGTTRGKFSFNREGDKL